MARVVIADHRDHIGQMLAAWLIRHGHEAVAVSTQAAALAALKHRFAQVLIAHADLEGTGRAELVSEALGTCPELQRVFVIGGATKCCSGGGDEKDPRISALAEPFSPTGLLLGIAAVKCREGNVRTPAFAYGATTLAVAEDAVHIPFESGGLA